MKRDIAKLLAEFPELSLVAEERAHQVFDLGWTLDHDREFNPDGELVLGAIAYAKLARRQARFTGEDTFRPADWPWDGTYWNPAEDPAENLIKAAAMLLAEARRITKDSPPSSQ